MRRFGRMLLVVAVLCVLLVSAIALTLAAESGRRMLAGVAGTAASRIAGLDIRIDGLRPLALWHVEVGRITVAAEGRPIATVDDIRAGWSWSDLRRLDFRPRSLGISRLDIRGLPPDDAGAAGTGLPALAPPLLPVQALAIDRIDVDAAVLGEALTLSLSASETLGGADSWSLDLDLVRLDRPTDRVRVAIGYGAAAGSLRVEAEVAEAAGGLLGRRLGTEAGRVDLILSGEGPAQAWRGRLTARIEGVAETEATLTLAVGQGVDAEIDGSARAAGLRPDPGPIAYRAALRWDGSGAVEIRRASADTALGALTLQGRVDGPAIDLSGTARLDDLSRFDPALGGRGALSFQARGTIDDLKATGDFDSSLLLPDGIKLGTLTARAEIGLRPGGLFDATIDGEAGAFEGLPAAVHPLLGSSATYALQLRRDASGSIRVDRFAVTAGAVGLDGSADIRPDGGESAARFALSLPDLAALRDLAGMALSGRAVAEGRIAGDIASGSYRLEGAARLEDLATGDRRLSALLGSAPGLDYAALWDRGVVHIEAATVTLAGGDLRLDGEVDTGARTLSLRLGAGIEDIAPLAPGIARGALALEAKLSGPIDSPAVTGDARLRGAAVQGYDLPAATARFDLRDVMGDLTGRVQADLGFTAGRIGIGGDLAFSGGRLLSARRLAITAPGITLGGDLGYDLVHALAEGALELRAASIGPAARIAGLALDGRADGTIRFERAGERQRVAIRLDAAGLSLDGITLARAGLRGSIDDALGTPALRFDLQGADLLQGDNRVATLSAGLEGTQKALRFRAEAAGTAGKPFRVSLGGAGALDGAAWRLDFDRLAARFAEVPIDLRGPFSVAGDAGAVSLSPVRFGIDKGDLVIEGRLDAARVDVRLRFDSLPAALARIAKPDLNPEGLLGGDLRIAGRLDAVEGTFTLKAEGLRATPDLPRLSLAVRADLAGDRMRVGGQVTGMGETPLDLKADIPLLLRLRPFALALPPGGAVSGAVSGPVSLGRVLALVLPVDDQITGTAVIEASLDGTIAAPRAAGSARLTGGRYLNATSEAVVDDLALEITAEGRRLALRGNGTDGSGGTVALSGHVELDPDAKFPLQATLALRDFRAARRDDATARLSANLALGPDLGSPALEGEITVVEADIRIPDRLPPNVVVLNVREINRPGVQDDVAVPPPAAPLVVGLDLRIAAPNRIFVRGRGLDSEFGGAFTVRGTTREPLIAGDLKVIRGTLDLLGKRLTVESGSIVFPGGARIDPDIAAVASFPAGRTTGEVALSGTLSAPTIKLGSRSGLPQDEVLSQLLFGTGTASLTPFQAIQLAQSAATLVSGSTGGGPLEQLRRRVGLDRLDVQGGTGTEGPSVEVGKYLAPNILLKAQQGTGATGPSVGVEVELTPNISVDTRVGADAKSSIGVNLKTDY